MSSHPMTIYIASSWKNMHAVEMLTEMLRQAGHTVLSFIENNHGEQQAHLALYADGKEIPFDQWVNSERGTRSFIYDTEGAMRSDLVIYVGPSGCDAWAEVGAAYGNCRPILGLSAKGEQVGLMRRMIGVWHQDYRSLLKGVEEYADQLAALAPAEGMANV